MSRWPTANIVLTEPPGVTDSNSMGIANIPVTKERKRNLVFERMATYATIALVGVLVITISQYVLLRNQFVDLRNKSVSLQNDL